MEDCKYSQITTKIAIGDEKIQEKSFQSLGSFQFIEQYCI